MSVPKRKSAIEESGYAFQYNVNCLRTDSPSRKDGISLEQEKRLRRKYIALVQESGVLLELPNNTICTAAAFFHRFFAVCSLAKFDPVLVVEACLFLASKVGETGRRVRDVINVTYCLLHPNEEPLQVSEQYWLTKDSASRCEQQLLRVLGFDLDVKHPHHYLLHIVRELEGTEQLATVAYYICNDSMQTALCLQYPPAVIACAAVHLAGEFISEQIAAASWQWGQEWWERFGVSRLELEDISHQLLDVYETADASNPPTFGTRPRIPAGALVVTASAATPSANASPAPVIRDSTSEAENLR